MASAQRSSPQFSFPQPGGELFSTNGQDFTSLGLPSTSQLAQSSQQQAAGDQQPQLISSSVQPAQQQQQQQQTQRSPQSAGLPGLQLSSSAASGGSSSASSAAVAAASQQQALNRQRQQAADNKQRQTANAAASVAHAVANRHPANIQPSRGAGSQQSQQSQQAAIEAGRRADATSASLAASSGQAYHCPDSFGYFRHHKSCDKYWACENNTATLKLCGNGLMFDDSDPRRENCAYPFSVECGSDRTDVEAPISTQHCPRLYGLFHDPANCRVFYSCWNGEASRYECPAGLAYDSEHRVCVWADHVDRCDQSEVSDGFVCPDPTEADQPGHYTRHAHPTDCRKFYVCIEGVARPYGCSIGTVFNVDSLQCDEPENVSGCEKYYGDLDPKLAKKLARENVQQSSGAAPSRSGQNVSGGGASNRPRQSAPATSSSSSQQSPGSVGSVVSELSQSS